MLDGFLQWLHLSLVQGAYSVADDQQDLLVSLCFAKVVNINVGIVRSWIVTLAAGGIPVVLFFFL
jgi:hypothetical protein